MSNALPVPVDVKLMNVTATLLFIAFACLSLGALCMWVLRQPVFAIGAVEVRGEVTHNNAVTLRANVAPRLRGTFFTVDLAETRAAFETVPWVRRAVVRRSFPNRLDVALQEHQAAAFWGAEGSSQLLNSFGEVFEANVDEVHRSDLPRPVSSSSAIALSSGSNNGASVRYMPRIWPDCSSGPFRRGRSLRWTSSTLASKTSPKLLSNCELPSAPQKAAA
jgi:hypothetical protein